MATPIGHGTRLEQDTVTRLAFGFYPASDDTTAVLASLSVKGYRRAAAITRSQDGDVRVKHGSARPTQWGVLGALVTLLGTLLLELPLFVSLPATLIGFLAVWFAISLTGAGVEKKLIARYSRWVLEGETLVIVKTQGRQLVEVVEILKTSGTAAPATFFARQTERKPSDARTASGRSERLAGERLKSEAARLAATQKAVSANVRPDPRFLKRLDECSKVLRCATEELSESVRLEQTVTPAAEWLLDNNYIIEAQIGEIRRNLPAGHEKLLALVEGASGGASFRIYEIARALVRSVDSHLDRENLVGFLRAYQSLQPLGIAELWILPLVLRLVLIEELEAKATDVNLRQQGRENADFWANRVLNAARRDPDQLLLILGELAREHRRLDPHFAIRLNSHLYDEEAALSSVQRWVERETNATYAELVQQEQARQAGDQVTVANAVTSLRLLTELDWRVVFEQLSEIDRILADDPAGAYKRCDFHTRDRCRSSAEELARHSKLSEIEVARKALELARGEQERARNHVGNYLIGEERPTLERACNARVPVGREVRRALTSNATVVYLGSTLGLTLAIEAALLSASVRWWNHPPWLTAVLALLALFPASEIAIQAVNQLIVRLFEPRVLPKMEFKEGIPDQNLTMVVVPMILLTEDAILTQVHRLEVNFLANRDPNLIFALLSDFADAPRAEMPEDSRLLGVARRAIEELNEKYSASFLLFHRPRTWSDSENTWLGWERKRGKLEQVNHYLISLKGDPDLQSLKPELPDGSERDYLIVGDTRRLADVRFVITVDADTQMPVGTARRLVETLAHPLNEPQVEIAERRVARGFGVIQPRFSVALPHATATAFTRLFTRQTGTDPYSRAVSDAYQDLFGESIYHGKAIYDLRAFYTVLSARIPQSCLLSHDLLEGCYVRTALASDIELFEDFPHYYSSYCSRQHRWTRGDWQAAHWILPWVPLPGGRSERNPLSLISRWKLLDNLRRSVVPIASVLLVIGAAVFGAPVWQIVVGAYALIPVISLLGTLHLRATALQGSGWPEFKMAVARAVVSIVLMPHSGWLAADAIVRAKYRKLFSKRRLLEWETAQLSHSFARHRLHRVAVQNAVVALLSAGLGFLLLQADLAVWAVLPWVLLWMAAPAVASELSHTRRPLPERALSEADVAFARLVARQTWRYFDDLVGPATNWLPPDNSQEALNVEIAERTSPTNIGMWLLSVLTARDFGYLTTAEMVERLSATLETLGKLERHEGHLLNWYDTRTLEPLRPPYVSTVDSGNLLACFIVLKQALLDLQNGPLLGREVFDGLRDALDCLKDADAETKGLQGRLAPIRTLLDQAADDQVTKLEQLTSILAEIRQVTGQLRSETGPAEELYWLEKASTQVTQWADWATDYLGWLPRLANLEVPKTQEGVEAAALRDRLLAKTPTLAGLAGGDIAGLFRELTGRLRAHSPELIAPSSLQDIERAFERAQMKARRLLRRVRRLRERLDQESEEINLGFLYDLDKRLFTIGYNPALGRRDNSYYDLLLTEARLASFLAVARGEVPAEHWFTLGRPFRNANGRQLVMSWTGTMFEYLMPLLFTRCFRNSLLEHACRVALEEQIDFGRHRSVPWGISESAFSALDARRTYQYRAFGVPSLALHREAETPVVVAPYATALALLLSPAKAIQNLRRLAALGLQGPRGYYEAVDYTRLSRREGEPGVIIYAYMAHHQGMTLLALGNAVLSGIMQERFHADPLVKAAEPLLYEGKPENPPVFIRTVSETRPIRAVASLAEPGAIRVTTQDTPVPRTQLLSNGNYCAMVTNSGGGYSRWRDFDITRWRADTTRDHWGTFLYFRDVDGAGTWSLGFHPLDHPERRYSVTYASEKVEFRRRDHDMETEGQVVVSPEDDAEIRLISLTNRSLHARTIELTSYTELALAPHPSDRAHPAFSNLFVETRAIRERRALVAWRRKRSPEEPTIWVGQLLVGVARPGEFSFETDRSRFVGRGRSLRNPKGLREQLDNTEGYVLDPIFALRSRITLHPRERARAAVVTVAAGSEDELMALLRKYSDLQAASRVLELAWAHTQLQFRYLGVQIDEAQQFQELSSYMIYPNEGLRPSPERLRRNALGQSGLWAMGISGDVPILLVTVADENDFPVVREALLAHIFWRARGLKTDLVVLNEENSGYDQPLHQRLQRMVQAHWAMTGMDRPGGVFLRVADQISKDEQNLLFSAARVTLVAARGSLSLQLSRTPERPEVPPPLEIRNPPPEEPSPPLPFLDLAEFNGIGGFTEDGREYAIYLPSDVTPPLPWVNVIANPMLGTVVSDSGIGCTWHHNSQRNRLTPWSNDPVQDEPSEAIYIRDEQTGAYWTPTPLPIREKDPYRIRHGQGYSIFEHNSHGIEQQLTTFVPMYDEGGDPIRVQTLRLKNSSSHRRSLSITPYVEWVLGTDREETQMHLATSWDSASQALLARNAYHPEYGQKVAFATMSPSVTSFTADRTAFLGRNRSMASPAAMTRKRLMNRKGAGLDACAALQTRIELNPGEETELVFLLGQADNVQQARALIQQYKDSLYVEESLAATQAWWETLLRTVEIETPDQGLNFLLNRWLMYQTLSCRIWARTAFYQSGGAFGFRDQLQDTLALLYAQPALVREHLLTAARHQFTEGDVQHWWHEPSGAGVRTRCSDDLLWLPYVVARYVGATSDKELIDVRVPFLQSPILEPHEHESYSVPVVSMEDGSLYQHCRRAIEKSLSFGPHGLPLIGSGDWNDGMNRVGIQGTGESVWLAWFQIEVFKEFIPICRMAGDSVMAEKLESLIPRITESIEQNAWDGEWYRRAYFDDGSPLGSALNEEARIDSLPQSWAAIAGTGDPERARMAMNSLEKHLVKRDLNMVLLFSPPFNHSTPHPGYIIGYPPGVRENGGQYTHGAIWAAAGFARLGDGTKAAEILQMLSPIRHASSKGEVGRYKGEAYAVAADVYSLSGHEGRAGWTWYTGSSGWMYRIWLEEIMGVRLVDGQLILRPNLPDGWRSCRIVYRHGYSSYEIQIDNCPGVDRVVASLEVNGDPMEAGPIPLIDDGRHHILRVRLRCRDDSGEELLPTGSEDASGS